jgi:hypothetical protein
MSDIPDSHAARLFTSFSTAVYVDADTGQLQHRPFDPDSNSSAWLVPEPSSGPLRRARLTAQEPRAIRRRLDREEDCPTNFDVVPLERGLFGLAAEGLFLCAEPGGRVGLSRPTCSTWEVFLASEPWCAAGPSRARGDQDIDRKAIQRIIVDPRLRTLSGLAPPAEKILIFGYPGWSHGRVYYDLCRELSLRGHVVDIMNWQFSHAEYIEKLKSYYDLFMTAPDGVAGLADSYGVPYENMIVVSHSEFDMRLLIEQKGVAVFDAFAAFGVVSSALYSAALMQGIRRAPQVVPLAIDYDAFAAPSADRLETVGYASSMTLTSLGVELKRGHLAKAAADAAGLEFKVAGSTAEQMSFHDMPDFYRTVGAVLVSSIAESGPLPVMEAAAAGRLVIGTPVGHIPTKAYEGAGILAPIEPHKYVKFAAETLRYYKQEPSAYVEKCQSMQEVARRFDWRYAIADWVELIDAARSA